MEQAADRRRIFITAARAISAGKGYQHAEPLDPSVLARPHWAPLAECPFFLANLLADPAADAGSRAKISTAIGPTEVRRTMRRARSGTIQSIALLAILPWTNLAVVQAQAPIIVQSHAAQAAEDRILAILRRPFAVSFENRSLGKALAGIARTTGVPIQVDTKVLEEASISLDSPVSCDSSSVTLRSALDLILSQRDLTWIVHDECLLVTTPDKASNHLVAKIYPVQDFARALNGPDPYAAHCGALIEMITSTIAPTTWDEVGGPGSITFFAPSGSLIISQTREVHEEIETLLPALRVARDIQGITAVAPNAARPPASHLTAPSAARAGRSASLDHLAHRPVVAAASA